VWVVGGHAGHCARWLPDAVDDRCQDVGEFGADDQQSLGVGLGRGDLQQRDDFGAGRRCVLDQAVVAEFGELFDADPGVSQRFDGRPGPEGPVLLPGEVPARARGGVLAPDLGGRTRAQRCAVEFLAVAGELLTVAGGLSGPEPVGADLGSSVDAGHERRQRGKAFSGPLIHPGLASTVFLGPCQVLAADRAWRRPKSPASGFFHRPSGDVQVESADLAELGSPVGT